MTYESSRSIFNGWKVMAKVKVFVHPANANADPRLPLHNDSRKSLIDPRINFRLNTLIENIWKLTRDTGLILHHSVSIHFLVGFDGLLYQTSTSSYNPIIL